MEVNDIKNDEAQKVLYMYDRFRNGTKVNSLKSFCEDYLNRCECCNEIVYQDTLEKIENWDGKILNCCELCVDEIKSGNKTNDDDDTADEYYEEMKIGNI